MERTSSIIDPMDFDLYIFDMGNVVIRDIEVLGSIAKCYGFDPEELRQDYRHYMYPLMDGSIDAACYWSHVSQQFGIQVSGDPLADHFRPRWNKPVEQLIRRLRLKGKRVVVGSNTYAPHWEWLREQGFLAIFDADYPSYRLGISKPSRRFFTHILEKEQVSAGKTFFMDDAEEHVAAAGSLGIHSLLYVLNVDNFTWFDPIFT